MIKERKYFQREETRPCVVCDDLFHPRRGKTGDDQKFCSRECWYKSEDFQEHRAKYNHKMWLEAQKANTGKPRSNETRKRISNTRLEKTRASGHRFCEYLDLPVYIRDGYEVVCIDGKHVRRHRAIYEHLFEPIPEGYHIHHVDGNKLNNVPNNLIALSPLEHGLLHATWKVMKHYEGFEVSPAHLIYCVRKHLGVIE